MAKIFERKETIPTSLNGSTRYCELFLPKPTMNFSSQSSVFRIHSTRCIIKATYNRIRGRIEFELCIIDEDIYEDLDNVNLFIMISVDDGQKSYPLERRPCTLNGRTTRILTMKMSRIDEHTEDIHEDEPVIGLVVEFKKDKFESSGNTRCADPRTDITRSTEFSTINPANTRSNGIPARAHLAQSILHNEPGERVGIDGEFTPLHGNTSCADPRTDITRSTEFSTINPANTRSNGIPARAQLAQSILHNEPGERVGIDGEFTPLHGNTSCADPRTDITRSTEFSTINPANTRSNGIPARAQLAQSILHNEPGERVGIDGEFTPLHGNTRCAALLTDITCSTEFSTINPANTRSNGIPARAQLAQSILHNEPGERVGIDGEFTPLHGNTRCADPRTDITRSTEFSTINPANTRSNGIPARAHLAQSILHNEPGERVGIDGEFTSLHGTSRDLTPTYSKSAFTPVKIPISNVVGAEKNDKNEETENIGIKHAGTGQNVSSKCDSIKVAVKGLLNFNKFKRY